MSDSDFVKKRSRRQPAQSVSTTATSVPDDDDDVVAGGESMPAGAPMTAPNYRLMKAVVIGLGVLMGLAFAALVVGFILRLTGHSTQTNGPAAAHYELPAGSKILSLQVTGNRLVLGVHNDQGSEVDIFDTDTGQLVGQIKPKPK